VICGLLTGLALVVFLVFSRHDPLWGMNAGFVALAANGAVTLIVSLLSKERRPRT
jgi:SSS family solute:Na+ symporter